MPLVVAVPQWWGWFPYFGNDDGEKIEKYSHEIEGKKQFNLGNKQNLGIAKRTLAGCAIASTTAKTAEATEQTTGR